MVTGVALACAVVLACALILLAFRRLRIRSDRRLEAVLMEIDEHLGAISTSVAQAIDRVAEARGEGPQLFLTLDFEELVDTLVAEAASRTGADAAVLRIEGPGGRPVVAALGPSVDGEQLERAFGPPDARRFRSATTDWTYDRSDEQEGAPFHSALVAPLEPTAGGPGAALAVYSTAPGAFNPAHATALSALVDEAATGLTNARRFAEVEARSLLDPATGVPNPRGYELELGREVARAHRSGRPLSVVLVGIDGASRGAERGGNGVADVARLLTRVTRKSDISCRRGEREFAILLPGTREAGATTLTNRLREAAQTLGVGRSTLTVGYVEWHPDETIEALDARADAALGRGRAVTALAPRRAVGKPATEPASELRRDALETLAGQVDAAHRLERSLALVVLDVDGLGEIAERLGREAADSVLDEVANRLDESLGTGSAHRLGPDEFALVLAESTAHDAEALIGAVQASLDPPPGVERLTLCAGITELAHGESGPAALERAEHALWQAKQVGHGTVVVAVPGTSIPPPR